MANADAGAALRVVRGYLIGLAAILAALGLRWLLDPWLHGRFPFLTLFGAVAATVWIAGAGPAAVAAVAGFVLSGPWLWRGFDVTGVFGTGYAVAAIGYSVSCGLIVVFGEHLQRSGKRLEREVIERRRAEEKLAESEEHYRFTVEFNPQVSWTADSHGALTRIAPRWTEWTGIKAGGAAALAAIHPDDLSSCREAWLSSIRTGHPYDMEHRIRMKSGDFRWMRSRAYPRTDASDRIVTWYGSTEDIHERKLSDQRLAESNAHLEDEVRARTAQWRASEERLRAVFESSFLYQAVLSPDGTLIDANVSSLSAVGALIGDVVGRPYSEAPWFAGTPDMPSQIRKMVAMAQHGRIERTVVLQLPAGSRRFEMVVRPVPPASDSGPVFLVAEAMDVTDRYRAEENLRQLQKMEAVGQLTGGIAHDFNNLLQVISANLQLMAKSSGADSPLAKRIESARTGVQRGVSLTKQLLAFSRRQALEPSVLNPGRLISGMEEMLRRALGESVEIEIVVSGGLWNTLVDATQIETAVLNLAINARDAMSGSGKLTIEVLNAVLDEFYVREVPELSAGQYVLIAVSDNGSGMSAEIAARATEPFFTTKPVGSGTGLGLSMVYGFVKQSGGHLKIYSEVGCGTTVKLYLPRSHAAIRHARLASAEALQEGSETVLLVEDDDGVRESANALLRGLGYRVLEASNADDAWAMIERGEEIDVLFTDVVMPGNLSSAELASRAGERLPGIAVLFTSGYTQNAIVHRGRLDAGVNLLAKPYTQESLGRRIREVLDARLEGETDRD